MSSENCGSVLDNVQQMKCPSCGAPIELDAGLEAVGCEYCGTKVFVDDEVYKYQRVLKAQSEAKHRDAIAQLELEKQRVNIETKRKVVNAFSKKPVEFTAVLLCTIWLLSKIISGRFNLGFVLIEVAVIAWAIETNRRPLAVKNMGIYFRNNIKQAIVFVFSIMTILYCITNETGMLLIIAAFCALFWSVRSGKKKGMIIDADNDIRFIYPKGGSYHYNGKQWRLVAEELMACGFTNIQIFENKDLIKGWFAKEGEVSNISIDGDSSFDEGQEFPSNARVIIEYHAFK